MNTKILSNVGNGKRKSRRRGKRVFIKTMPDFMYVQMDYSTALNMVDLGGEGFHTMCLNDCFDPDFTGLGHQPLGYDQWASFYRSLEVISSDIDVTIGVGTGINPLAFGVFPAELSTPPGNVDTAIEQPYAVTMYPNTGANSFTVRNSMSVRKLEGRSTASVNYGANFGSSPSARRYWHVYVKSSNGTSITPHYFRIRIKYKCRIYKRLALSGS